MRKLAFLMGLMFLVSLALAGSAAGSDATPRGNASAQSPGSSLKALDKTVLRQRKRLGAKTTNSYRRLVKSAINSQRRGKVCSSLRPVAKLAKAALRLKGRNASSRTALLLAARKSGEVLLERGKPRGCGIRAPRISVSSKVKPSVASLPASYGLPRKLAKAEEMEFVEGRLVVGAKSPGALRKALRSAHGKVLASTPSIGGVKYYLLSIKPRGATGKVLSKSLKLLDPGASGRIRVSSRAGVATYASMAKLAAGGAIVGLDIKGEPAGFIDRSLVEGPTGPPGYRTTPYAWTFMNGGAQDIGTPNAWRRLALAGKIPGLIPVVVADSGFASGPTGIGGAPPYDIPHPCGAHDCDTWHGSNVLDVLGAAAGDYRGVAGSAGGYARMTLVNYLDMWDLMAGLRQALTPQTRIINIPGTLYSNGLEPLEPLHRVLTAAIEGGKRAIFAPAPNADLWIFDDIERETCDIAGVLSCERIMDVYPCQFAPATCVAGMAPNSTSRDPRSMYSAASCDGPPCNIDLGAPFSVYAGPDPLHPNNRLVNGNSFASAYAAGVAALVAAADQRLTGKEIVDIITRTALRRDITLNRNIKADAAVAAALKGVRAGWPPYVQLVEPDDRHRFKPIGSRWTFSVLAGDPLGNPACCGVYWSSDKEGPLGTGTTISKVLTTQGTHHITVSVVGGSTIKFDIGVTPPPVGIGPVVRLDAPAPNVLIDPAASTPLHATVTETDGGPVAQVDYQFKSKTPFRGAFLASGLKAASYDTSVIFANRLINPLGEEAGTVTVFAKDSNGTATDSVPVVLNWGPG